MFWILRHKFLIQCVVKHKNPVPAVPDRVRIKLHNRAVHDPAEIGNMKDITDLGYHREKINAEYQIIASLFQGPADQVQTLFRGNIFVRHLLRDFVRRVPQSGKSVDDIRLTDTVVAVQQYIHSRYPFMISGSRFSSAVLPHTQSALP